MLFSEMTLPATLQKELATKGYDTPTAVQEAVVQEEHAGKDLLVSSRTGSGKTIAFGLAASSAILDDAGRAGIPGDPRMLVVAPTRELAQQVARELTWLYRATGARVTTCVGGMEPRREVRALQAGVHIVVGTPGRLVDHLERGALNLASCKVVVLDEADEMLDMGFREELEGILDKAPAERRTLLFSATFPRVIEQLAKRYTKNATRIEATDLKEQHQDIDTIVHLVHPRERSHAVVNVLRAHDAPSALVFCATRDGTSNMCAGLVERGFSAVALSGELSQAERNRAIQGMRDGRARVLVATDVAARGLDLPSVALVIHADLPFDSSVLQHRSGRTGRAGKKGTAVILVPYPQERIAQRIVRDARITPRVLPPPSFEDIRALDDERMRTRLRALAGEVEPDDLEAGRALLLEVVPEIVAAALIRSERRSLPAAEDLSQASAHRRDEPVRRGPPDLRERSRGDTSDGAWFRVNVGREKNADPKWLVPLICRRGGVTKRDIGRIDIGDRETRFEINPKLARAFIDSASKPDAKDPHVRIEPVR